MGAKEQGANQIDGRWLTIPRTLCFVRHGDNVLLMKRAPHKRIFPNQFNGLGGHIERDEDPYTGAIREIKEESGLDVHAVRLRAIHHIDTGEATGIMLFIFTAWAQHGELSHTSTEGTLHWVPIKALSEYDLVEDLPYYLERILTEPEEVMPVFVHVSYDDDDTIHLRTATES